VHVVEVDDVGLQPLQAFVDALVDIGGVAARIEPARGEVGWVGRDAEFGCQRDLIAPVGEQL
jgi:hypothetical protein